MNDAKVLIVNCKFPDEFTEKVNAILLEGGWRVVHTEMSVCDHHYSAMMVKCMPVKSTKQNLQGETK